MNAAQAPRAAEAHDRPARLRVGVVGAGRVGPVLAAALR
ncbi:oxidoreductase, partial [Streptomyces triticirhizae]